MTQGIQFYHPAPFNDFSNSNWCCGGGDFKKRGSKLKYPKLGGKYPKLGGKSVVSGCISSEIKGDLHRYKPQLTLQPIESPEISEVALSSKFNTWGRGTWELGFASRTHP
jgi:hypothetical protein